MLCIQAIVFIVFAILNYSYYLRQGITISNNMNLFLLVSNMIFIFIINYVCLLDYGTLAWVLAILPFIDIFVPDKFKPTTSKTTSKTTTKTTTKTTSSYDKKKESFGEVGRPISTMDYGKTPYSFY